MKKIIVDKEDGVAEVIDGVLNEPDKDITLVVPRGSALGRSARNFHLLKREADAAGRTVVIESVDEGILQFAKDSDIEASHPLWRGVRGAGGMSDIVPKTESMEEEQEETVRKIESSEEEVVHIPLARGGKKTVETRKVTVKTYGDDEDEDENESEHENQIGYPKALSNNESSSDNDDSPEGRSHRVLWWVIGGIVLVGAGVYVFSTVFAHADVTIDFQKTPWSYQGNFVADKAATSITAANVVTIPAQVFTSTKNVTQSFPASGSSNDSQKAKGTITIYNNYGTDPQELVATTRFQTPDGKIFRLVSNATVPGAKKNTDGSLTPSAITVAIVADQAGPAYNVGPVPKLTIPGFASDPGREAGFYGAITGTTNGGSNGTHAVPTAADITAAKASTTAILQAALTGNLSASYPNNFKILDGATDIQITKLSVNTSTDQNGNFTVFGEASLQAIGFDEAAFKTYLLSLAQATEQNSVFTSTDLSYGGVTANFTKGQVSFSLSAQANLEPAFSAGDFASSIAGKSISGARDTIVLLQNLADGKISVWPLWLWDIPSNPAKIHVTAN